MVEPDGDVSPNSASKPWRHGLLVKLTERDELRNDETLPTSPTTPRQYPGDRRRGSPRRVIHSRNVVWA